MPGLSIAVSGPVPKRRCFVLAGDDLGRRLALARLFEPAGALRTHGILEWDESRQGETPTVRARLGMPLQIGREVLSLLTVGERYQPAFGNDFPAERIHTPLDWEDLVLAPHIAEEVAEIRGWIEHRDTLMQDWGLQRQIKPGFRALFYGPPGTGKTLTASPAGQKHRPRCLSR